MLKIREIIKRLEDLADQLGDNVPVNVYVRKDISEVVDVSLEYVGTVANGKLVDVPEVYIRGWKY